MDTKYCKYCDRERPRGQFTQSSTTKDGYKYYCRECLNQRARERYGDRYESESRKKRNDHYKARYGITVDEFEAMLVAQDYGCAICGRTNKTRSLAVDHCHTTGQVRGLLCDSCNLGIGKFSDNPELFQKVIEYLSRD